MSVIYCEKCNKQIDTDHNAEHFQGHKEESQTLELYDIWRERELTH